MKTHKIYEPEDKLITLIRDNYSVLQALGSFGIQLGFGDNTVDWVCRKHGIDTYTFLAVVNFLVNDCEAVNLEVERLSVPTLLHYLRESHIYFLDFQLPFIRRELEDSIDIKERVGQIIIRFYGDYEKEIRNHMTYEERGLFPYVEKIINGETVENYSIETFSKRHGSADKTLKELKSIIIKYLPPNKERSNKLNATLYDIYNNEEWLEQHCKVEDQIFVPAIRHLEKMVCIDKPQGKVANKMPQGDSSNALSSRERDIVVCLVRGMSNKEIAEHLFISVNTVITHRRNITRKLQLHSSAGLIIYAVVNGLVDISTVKL